MRGIKDNFYDFHLRKLLPTEIRKARSRTNHLEGSGRGSAGTSHRWVPKREKGQPNTNL